VPDLWAVKALQCSDALLFKRDCSNVFYEPVLSLMPPIIVGFDLPLASFEPAVVTVFI
jgi:hypothetical protein